MVRCVTGLAMLIVSMDLGIVTVWSGRPVLEVRVSPSVRMTHTALLDMSAVTVNGAKATPALQTVSASITCATHQPTLTLPVNIVMQPRQAVSLGVRMTVCVQQTILSVAMVGHLTCVGAMLMLIVRLMKYATRTHTSVTPNLWKAVMITLTTV